MCFLPPSAPHLADILLQEIVDSSSSNPPTLLLPPNSSSPAPSGAAAADTAAVEPPAPQQPHTGLDGNIQPVVAAAPPSATANKIRINITKNVSNKIVINSSENTEKHQHQQHHLNSELNSTETSATTNTGAAAGSNADANDAASAMYNANCYAAGDPRTTYEANGDDASQGFDGMQLMTAADAAAMQASETMMATAAEPEPEIEFVFKESMRGIRFQRTPTVRSGVDASGLCSIM